METRNTSHPYVHHVIELPSPTANVAATKISCLLHPSAIPLLPSPTSAPVDPDPPYEILSTPHKGLGMFAKRYIPKGSLILTEHPAYVLPDASSNDLTFEDYEQVGRLLPSDLYEEVEKMANCRSKEECPSIIEGVARTNAFTIEFEVSPNLDGRDSRPGPRLYGGLFPKIGRCNHSCGPNAMWKWDFTSLLCNFFALRDIQPGEEISITYVRPFQSREARCKKLKEDYRFECDCPWCTFPTPSAQAESDRNREYLDMYLQTRPTYSKWSIDPCLPDSFVIDSLQGVSPIVRREGLDRLVLVFMEEIVRCLAELGQEDEFKRWAGETLKLCRVADEELAEELETILRDPKGNCSWWGRRTRLREEMQRNRDRYDLEADEDFSLDLLQVPE